MQKPRHNFYPTAADTRHPPSFYSVFIATVAHELFFLARKNDENEKQKYHDGGTVLKFSRKIVKTEVK